MQVDEFPHGIDPRYHPPVLFASNPNQGDLVPTTHLSLRSILTTSPVIAVNDIGSAADFMAAIEGTIRNFNDGDLVSGTVVQVGRDEVLVDIGYKTEGVIPSRELSIRHDADPNEIVKVGELIEALVLQKEDKEGRLILSK